METKGITIPIRTEVEPNDHLDRAVKALERIADALEKQSANVITVNMAEVAKQVTSELMSEKAANQVELEERLNKIEESNNQCWKCLDLMADLNHSRKPILLEIDRNKNQYGEPEVQVKSSPL